MTPQTDREWAKALAAVHPDIGGDAEVFLTLQAQRDQWRLEHPEGCRGCGKPVPIPRFPSMHRPRYCSLHCSNRAAGTRRVKPKRLRT